MVPIVPITCVRKACYFLNCPITICHRICMHLQTHSYILHGAILHYPRRLAEIACAILIIERVKWQIITR